METLERWIGTVARLCGRCRARSLAVAAVAGCLALALCYGSLVHTAMGRRFDVAAYGGALHPGSLRLGFLDPVLDHIDAKWLLGAVLVVFGIGLVRRRPVLGAAGALAAGGPAAADQLLRYRILDRAPFAVRGPLGDTFPSGHVITVAAFAMALVLVCPPRWRASTALAGSVLIVGVANQVQVMGWHRPSDVAGANLLAFAFVCATAAILARLRLLGGGEAVAASWCTSAMAAAAGVAAILAIFAYVHSLVLPGGLGSSSVQQQIYLADLGMTIAGVAVVMLTLTLLLGSTDMRPGWTLHRTDTGA